MQSVSGKPGEAAGHLLRLVLALYRHEISAMPEAELPDAMRILLRLANGDADLLDWARQVSGAGADEVRNSCIAFIEREFLQGDADPYRVLGLNPWATAEDIKEHYRLLIRLFHPDRGVVERTVAERYAAMINHAHNALKELTAAETLANHDVQTAAATTVQAGRPVHIRQRMVKPAATESTGYGVWGSMAWLTPAKVLGSIAVMATLIVLVLLMQEKRHGVRPADISMEAGTTAAGATNNGTINGTFETSHTEADSSEAGLGPTAISHAIDARQQVHDMPLKSEPKVPEPAIQAVFGAAAEAGRTAPAAPMKRHTANVSHKPDIPADIDGAQRLALTEAANAHGEARDGAATIGNPLEGAAMTQAAAADAHDAVTTSTANTDAGNATIAEHAPSNQELHDLIARFMGSYNRGDVNGFMQVFGEELRSDEVLGKLGLQHTYSAFFNSTTSRSMVLRDLQWQRSGTIAIGRAEYRASSIQAGDAEERTSAGSLRIEASRIGKDVVIVGFFHQAAKK